jgi:hypothetical protein
VQVGGESQLFEATADLELRGSVGPHVSATVGAGIAGRVFTVGSIVASAHAIPRASAGIWVPVETDLAGVVFGAAGELDLATTDIGPEGGSGERLVPAALRVEVRISPRRG